MERAKNQRERERIPSCWSRRLVVAFGVAVIASVFSYSQSDVAFAKRVKQSSGFLRFAPTAPAWMRDSLPPVLAEPLAIWFDTPAEFFVGKDPSIEMLQRAAEIDSLRGVAFENREIDEHQVAVFRGHPTITDVRLSNTPVTDEVFPILESFPRLAFVSLSLTDISPSGLEAFRRRHPEVKIQIDPVTASGLMKASKGRATFDGERMSANTLTLRGSLDDELLAAVRRLPVQRLVLEGVEAGSELADVIEDQAIETLMVRGGRIDASFAEAVANDHLGTVELVDVALTRVVAKALSAAPTTFVDLTRVTFEEKALAAFIQGKQYSGVSLRQLSLADDDFLGSASIDHLRVEEVRFSARARPFDNAVIWSLTLDRIEAEHALLANLVGVPTDALSIVAPALHGAPDHSWPAVVRAEEHVALSGMALDSEETRAIAAIPTEHLSLMNIDWRGHAVASLQDVRARTLTLDRLPIELAEQVASSTVETLEIRESLSGGALAELGRMKNLKRLQVQLNAATPQQLVAVTDAPSLEVMSLGLESPLALPVEFWQSLSESHPGLRLNAYRDTATSDGMKRERLWPR